MTLQYCLKNDLAINPTKTTQINFSRRQDQIPNVQNITIEKQSKLLGIVIDGDLTWTDHINSLTKKLVSGIYAVRRIKWIGGLQAAKTTYHAVFESHIRYDISVWGGTSAHNLSKILLLQKKGNKDTGRSGIT
ncbi:hypothetical protein J6590_108323 [Homalodisca vitripennis]|nr:hypothetical protein J6590_108323 [Homalodisca vitripennis]